jgi:hypothetical protein
MQLGLFPWFEVYLIKYLSPIRVTREREQNLEICVQSWTQFWVPELFVGWILRLVCDMVCDF